MFRPSPNEATRPSTSPSLSDQPLEILNIKPGETVNERVLLLHGRCFPTNTSPSVVVRHHLDSFPSQTFPVTGRYFKCLVHLDPGPNQLSFSLGSNPSVRLDISYCPLLQNPPIHLVLLLGKDSPGTFDSPPYKQQQQGNGLEVAIKKLRMAGYMMAAFTSEQMRRRGFGRSTFRLHEEYLVDSLSDRDSSAFCRNTAKIHIVRTDKSVAELRDPNRAQQNSKGNDTGALFGIALEALGKDPFFSNTTTDIHVACLILDAHWDPSQQLITAHAALGGGAGHTRLAIFGSQALWSWPTCFEDLVPCLMDDTRTDTRYVANDSNQSGTAWECMNIGQGAFMHEIGHLLGCPHQESGIMLRGYITWNRSFTTTEGFCARTNGPGLQLALPRDECFWHPLDLIRFRYHPSFRRPLDPALAWLATVSSKPNVYPIREGAVAMADSGIYLVELHCEDSCRAFIELPTPKKQVLLSTTDLRARLPDKYRKSTLRLEILSVGEQVSVPDFDMFVSSSRLSDGEFRSNKLGGGSGKEATCKFPRPLHEVTLARVYSGGSLDGLELEFQSGDKCMFGNRGGSPHEVKMEPGEQLVHLFVRSGAWVDGLALVTTHRRTEVFGNPTGGGAHDLKAPNGYRITGLYGNIGAWVVSLGLIYSDA